MTWKRIANSPELRERMNRRAGIIADIRGYFRHHGFLEAETPIVVPAPGMEPNLTPLRTSHREQGGTAHPAYLITSPEYAMKKLLAAGFPKVFELARCFRDCEPWDGGHNPEFTMLEWYRADADYRDIMRDIEEMVAEVARRATGGTALTYQGERIELAPPWPRLTVAEAFRTHAGMDLDACVDDAPRFAAAARLAGYEIPEGEPFADAFFRVFLQAVEPALGRGRPTLLVDYPASMAALSRTRSDDPRYAERFEAYVCGIELANAFSELTDAAEQRRRLEEERDARVSAGKEALPIDEDFLSAVGAMPRSAGIALGVDRLVMLLTDARSIEDVLFFPAKRLFRKGPDPS